MKNKCLESCLLDFQNKDLSAMEKDCAIGCISKHMAIYQDLNR
jgi:hypothetical protein